MTAATVNALAMREAIDPDGNVIRAGMTIVCHGKIWIVSAIDGSKRHMLVCADRIQEDGRKCRLIVGRSRLRMIHVIGLQYQPVTYP